MFLILQYEKGGSVRQNNSIKNHLQITKKLRI